jgi:chromosome segregation ATPase
MRALTPLLLLLVSLSTTAGTRSVHRSEHTSSDGESRLLNIIRTDDDYYATWERDGVRYITRNAAVLAEIEEALDPQQELSKAHSALGRRHSELGREHSALGREHSRLGREYSRSHSEERQRELERMQQDLERKQQELEKRQHGLELEQQELERKQQTLERESHAKIDRIFERAVNEGKAKRD